MNNMMKQNTNEQKKKPNKLMQFLFLATFIIGMIFLACFAINEYENYQDDQYYRSYNTYNSYLSYDDENMTIEDTEIDSESLVVDTRVPNYKSTNPNYVEKTFSWESVKGSTLTLNYKLNQEMFEYYASLDRYYLVKEYDKYIYEENNAALCKSIAGSIRRYGIEHGYSDFEIVEEVVNFVQDTIEYQYDYNSAGEKIEYPKYPIETLFSKKGDCEDSVILLVTMLNELDYGTAVLDYEGHVAVGIWAVEGTVGTYYEMDGRRYYYVETTGSGWAIGEMPEEYRGKCEGVFVF